MKKKKKWKHSDGDLIIIASDSLFDMVEMSKHAKIYTVTNRRHKTQECTHTRTHWIANKELIKQPIHNSKWQCFEGFLNNSLLASVCMANEQVHAYKYTQFEWILFVNRRLAQLINSSHNCVCVCVAAQWMTSNHLTKCRKFSFNDYSLFFCTYIIHVIHRRS